MSAGTNDEILANVLKPMCPGCGSRETHRSRRRGLKERIYSWLDIWPYRCVVCSTRFLQPLVLELNEEDALDGGTNLRPTRSP